MKKKILLVGILIISICLVLTGCENKEVETSKNTTTENEAIKTNKTAENNNKNEETKTDIDLNIEELYSDNSKLVYKNEDTYMVFTYSGEKITGFTAYEEYASAYAAQLALEEYNKDPDPDVAKVYLKGRYLVAEFKDSEYTTFSVSELKQAMSYLQEMTK